MAPIGGEDPRMGPVPLVGVDGAVAVPMASAGPRCRLRSLFPLLGSRCASVSRTLSSIVRDKISWNGASKQDASIMLRRAVASSRSYLRKARTLASTCFTRFSSSFLHDSLPVASFWPWRYDKVNSKYFVAAMGAQKKAEVGGLSCKLLRVDCCLQEISNLVC